MSFPAPTRLPNGMAAGARNRIVTCDVRRAPPDAATVDALARLQLAAGRHGFRIVLGDASADLRRLVSFMGLGDVLPTDDFSPRFRSNGGEPSNGEV